MATAQVGVLVAYLDILDLKTLNVKVVHADEGQRVLQFKPCIQPVWKCHSQSESWHWLVSTLGHSVSHDGMSMHSNVPIARFLIGFSPGHWHGEEHANRHKEHATNLALRMPKYCQTPSATAGDCTAVGMADRQGQVVHVGSWHHRVTAVVTRASWQPWMWTKITNYNYILR